MIHPLSSLEVSNVSVADLVSLPPVGRTRLWQGWQRTIILSIL